MASVSKRKWRTPAGELRSAWVVSFSDQDGKPQRRQFPSKREADEERVRVERELSQGTHVPDGKTVGEAAHEFLDDFWRLVEDGERDRSTHKAYAEHVNLHISKMEIAKIKLSRLAPRDCQAFATKLQRTLSGAMARRVFGTFKSILKFSRQSGWITADPVQEITVRARRRRRAKIPSKSSLGKLLAAARRFDEPKRDGKDKNNGRAEAFVSLLLMGGLRISELLGVRRLDVDVERCCVTVTQRADRWREIGDVKTDAGNRTVPLPAVAIAAIALWKSKGPRSDQDLLFPNGKGKVDFYQNVYRRLWLPLMLFAGLANKTTRVDGQGREKVEIKPEFGMHALRHAAVSLWIEQGANPLQVQKWAGHSKVQFTLDVYGHLWSDPVGDARIVEGAAQSLAEYDISHPSNRDKRGCLSSPLTRPAPARAQCAADDR
jgi:integrase